MLGKVFARFVEKSPISVMVRGTLERVLGADQLNAWFARTAQKQYTRTVLFSTLAARVHTPLVMPAVQTAFSLSESSLETCSLIGNPGGEF